MGSNGWDYCILWTLSPYQRYCKHVFFEGSTAADSIANKPMVDDAGVQEAFQQSVLTATGEVIGHDKESVKMETGRPDSGSEGSDQVDDDEEQRPMGRGGKRHHSKNLVAERKRRKKLNDRLYSLRALVPKITKVILINLQLCSHQSPYDVL